MTADDSAGPSGMDGDRGAGDDAGAHEPDPYKRRVAVVLALLAVLGGWIGILRIDSATNESFFARETTRAAVQSLRANVNQSTVAGLGLDLDAEEAALGLATPFGDADADNGVLVGDGSADEQTAVLNAQDREALERGLTFEAERLDLLRAANAETRVTYNNRTSQYETVLTTLAVALFLVGFTLVLGPKTRPPVLIPGLLLAAYVGGWAMWIHQRDIPTTSTSAIVEAAEGATHAAFGEFDEAVASFGAAIELDDDFVSAYTGRSTASFLAANPDFATNLAVVETEGPLVDQAFADAETAVALGQDEDFPSLLFSGIYRFYDEDYEGAIERFESAVGVNDAAPEAYLLLAAASLAVDDDAGTRAALDSALDRLDTSQESTQNRQYAADALSLLEQVEAAVPERIDQVAAIRSQLVAGESALVFGNQLSGELPSGATYGVGRSEFRNDELGVSLDYAGLPDDTRLSIYVYEQPADGASFVQAAELARFVSVSGSGDVGGVVDVARRCRPVAFRYDVYADGALADSLQVKGGDSTC